jgi:hypothetical protein
MRLWLLLVPLALGSFLAAQAQDRDPAFSPYNPANMAAFGASQRGPITGRDLPPEGYMRGLTYLRQAQAHEESQQSESDASKRADTSRRIHYLYLRARESLEDAIRHTNSYNPALLAAGWNDVAFAEDKLGRPEAARRARMNAARFEPQRTP